MRLASVSLFEVSLPLRAAFETSSHRKASMTHIVVRIADSDGAVGYGECACEAAPFYGPETVATCWELLTRFLAPALLEGDHETPEAAAAALARFRGNHFAKAGLDMAVWDLFARRRGVSLAAALGSTRTEVASGVSLGIHEEDAQLAESLARVAAQGHRRIKLKIRPGMAEQAVATARATLGDGGPPLGVDANGSYGGDQRDELERLDGYGLALIEQPFGADEWLLHRDLQAAIATPVCLDEAVSGPAEARLALELGACRQMNLKVSRLGGLTAARDVHDVCHERDVPVWCGGMHEFGIGRAANLALASLPGFSLPGDISGSDERYERDIIDPPVIATDGAIPVPAGPGLGHAVDEELVRALAARTEHVGDAAAGREPEGALAGG